MQVYEYKLRAHPEQYAAIDEAIRTVQFVRNSCLRRWMDTRGTSHNDLLCLCKVLAATHPFAARLNSQARQASADRAWSAIARFYENCQKKKPGRKGYPRFQHDNRSVEYKQTGWKLEPDGKHLSITDGGGIGRLRLVGSKKQRLEAFPLEKIRRVRLVRRADGYYAQFAIEAERRVDHETTGKQVGIDVGLKVFLTDSEGNTVANPRHFRKAEKRLKRLHRRLSRCQKKSMNRRKARRKLGRAYLKVQRQREDFARKTASMLITSCDVIAYEHLQIAHLVKNRKLAKAISDASWGRFLWWLSIMGRCMMYTSSLLNQPSLARTVHPVACESRRAFLSGHTSVRAAGWCSIAITTPRATS